MDSIAQLDRIIPALSDVAAQVTPDQLDNPTPCAKYRVRDLLDHMIGGASAFGPQLRGQTPGEPPQLSDADRPTAFKAAMTDLLDALKAPGAMERTMTLPFGQVPGAVLARFLTVDGMVHTWDIAKATGQRYDPPADLVEPVIESAHALIAPEMRDGDTFAAAAPVPDDAAPIERLVAFTGRTV